MTASTSTAVLVVGSKGKTESTWQPRVSAAQQTAIESVIKGMTFTHQQDAEFGFYVATGDLKSLSPESKALLAEITKQCKASAKSASAAKRYWPRKVASVIVSA